MRAMEMTAVGGLCSGGGSPEGRCAVPGSGGFGLAEGFFPAVCNKSRSRNRSPPTTRGKQDARDLFEFHGPSH